MANPGRVAGEAEQKSPGGLIIPGFLEDNYQGTFILRMPPSKVENLYDWDWVFTELL